METRFETAFEKSIRPTISPSRGDGKLFVRLISDSTIKSGRPNLRSRVSITCVRFPGSDNNEETVSFAFPLRALRSLAIFSACENLHSADDARNCSKNTGHSSGSPEKLGSSLLANDCLATKCRRSSLSSGRTLSLIAPQIALARPSMAVSSFSFFGLRMVRDGDSEISSPFSSPDSFFINGELVWLVRACACRCRAEISAFRL